MLSTKTERIYICCIIHTSQIYPFWKFKLNLKFGIHTAKLFALKVLHHLMICIDEQETILNSTEIFMMNRSLISLTGYYIFNASWTRLKWIALSQRIIIIASPLSIFFFLSSNCSMWCCMVWKCDLEVIILELYVFVA